MNYLLLLCSILSFASLISIYIYKNVLFHFLNTTGLIFFNDNILFFNNISFLSTLLLSFILIYLIYDNNIYLSFFSLDIFGFIGFLELYIGLTLWMDPKAFLLEIYNKWEILIHSPHVENIQKKFQCCGFHRPGQIIGEKCDLNAQPCLKNLLNILNSSISSCGIGLLCHSFVHLFISLILFISSEKPKKIKVINLENEIQPLITK